MTEFAIVAPILVLMAMGVAEFGLAWRDSMTVSVALRSSARVASNAGSDRLADYEALQALEASIADIADTDVEQVVIFNAGTDSTPTQGCRDGTPSTTPGFECNVYTAADFDRPPTDFSGVGVCSATAPDRFWCPLGRDDDQGGLLDTVGVWAQVNHGYITGVFPGNGITIKDTTIMRLEPSL